MPSLVADSWHSWTDPAASAGVMLAVGLEAAGIPDADAMMALAIVAILAWSGVQVLLDAAKVLLDASIEPDVLAVVTRTAEADPRVRRVVRVDGRISGSFRFLHLTVVPSGSDVGAAEGAADEIGRAVGAAVQNIASVQIEFAPDDEPAVVVAVLLAADDGTLAADLVSARATALLRVDPGSGRLQQTTVVTHARALADPGRTIDAAVQLARLGANRLVVGGQPPSRGAGYVLTANAVDVVQRPELATLAPARAAAASLVPAATVAA